MSAPAPNPQTPGWSAQLQHRDHIAALVAAEAERRAEAAKPRPATRTRKRAAPRTRKAQS